MCHHTRGYHKHTLSVACVPGATNKVALKQMAFARKSERGLVFGADTESCLRHRTPGFPPRLSPQELEDVTALDGLP